MIILFIVFKVVLLHILLIPNGNNYHTWTFNSSSRTGYSSYLLPGGTVVRTVSNTGNKLNGGGITGKVQKVDWNGTLLWDFVYSSSTYCLHHDICPLPNGNVLMISYDVKTAAEATKAGCSKNSTIWSEKIIEVKQTGPTTGEIVWEWKLWDHLCQNVNSAKDNYVISISDHPELLNLNYNITQDWIHANGLDYNEELDQISISSHMLNEIYVIDHSATKEQAAGHTGGNSGKGGDFLYRWGNPAAYGATGTKVFNIIHDAHWIPVGSPRANYLVGFNNNGISTQKSCIDFINPPYNGYNYYKNDKSPYEPTTYNYRHTCNGHTNDEGNSQQLPNGNSLVCIAMAGILYEVDSLNTLLWSKTISTGSGGGGQGSISQAFRYSKCYVNGTIAPKPTITKDGKSLTSSYGKTYKWFYNGEPIKGASEMTLTPTINGKYYVQIEDDKGCESYLSAPFIFNDVTEVNYKPKENDDLMIYPNPTSGNIFS